MKIDNRLNQYLEKFKPYEFENYEVYLELSSPAVFYDLPHFDGILAKRLVENATKGVGLEMSAEPYFIPLPLKLAWQSKDLLPLWCSTDFMPLEKNEIIDMIWHKKGIKKLVFTKTYPSSGAKGSLKEFQIPLPVNTCLKWKASFYGDLRAVSSLLLNCQTIGKKTSQGYGVIRKIYFKKIDDFSFYNEDGDPMRPIPIAYLNDSYNLNHFGFKAWTPPYWHNKSLGDCIG